jgi:NADH dehydrogenase
MWSKARKRILVLGGGFEGISTVRALQKALRGRTDIEIALVNQENYVVFQPMLAEVISGNISPPQHGDPDSRSVPRRHPLRAHGGAY